MAVPSDDIEMASATKRKKRDSYDSTYTGDDSNSNSKGSNSKKASIAVPIDASVLEMISAVRDDEDSDDDSHKRKSQLFCFCCCDLITACIVMNAIIICLSIIRIIISEFATLDFGSLNIDIYKVEDDDDGIERLDPWGVLSYAKMGVGIFFALVGIVGAIKFNKYMVLSVVIWYFFFFILSAIGREFYITVISIPFAYTNIHCYMALRKGNITRENYATEKAICGGCERFD